MELVTNIDDSWGR